MKIMRKKRLSFILLTLVLSFLLYNLLWLTWRTQKYSQYTSDFEALTKFMSYIHTEEDYLYNVKLPDYLSYTGNLCVATRDGKSALLIWPKFNNEYEYGVQLEIDNQVYSIMINKNLQAHLPEFQAYISSHNDIIQDLFKQAEEMWHL